MRLLKMQFYNAFPKEVMDGLDMNFWMAVNICQLKKTRARVWTSTFRPLIDILQGDQINMAVLFWYLVKSNGSLNATVHANTG